MKDLECVCACVCLCVCVCVRERERGGGRGSEGWREREVWGEHIVTYCKVIYRIELSIKMESSLRHISLIVSII